MSITWTLEKILQLITDKVQESLTLDYKSAASLDKSDQKKITEITKDVSAMANSAGGTIIYGISEYTDAEKRQWPEKIDPEDQTVIKKEWLEQIINTIRPRINGIVITPIETALNSNAVVYVLDIPQSETAHQAKDFRYYKRFNFISTPMEDYEVRDVMSRNQVPKFAISFSMEHNNNEKRPDKLLMTLKNIGVIFAKYISVVLNLPKNMADTESNSNIAVNFDDNKWRYDLSITNIVRDKNEVVNSYNRDNIPLYGPSRYEPILPQQSRTWIINIQKLGNFFHPSGAPYQDMKINWTIYADNAQPFIGETLLTDIKWKRTQETP